MMIPAVCLVVLVRLGPIWSILPIPLEVYAFARSELPHGNW